MKMECKNCGSSNIRIYRHDVISVGTDVIGGEYACCQQCGTHVDLDEFIDSFDVDDYRESEESDNVA